MNAEGLQLAGAGFAAGCGAGILACATLLRRRVEGRAEKAIQERKDQFVSLTSHYLLNPLTVIQTAVAALQEKGQSAGADERQQLYDSLERGQQRLWIFVQQIILVSEIDSGNLRPQFGVASLDGTVDAAVAAVDPFARAKGVRIRLENGLREVREARFDQRRLKQAVIAILDNAVKFSLDQGEVAVVLGRDQGTFSIRVEDGGIGIPDEVMDHITEKFYRGTDTYTFDYEGVGLGLHVAQAIVRMHGGNLSITSKPKRGTVATIVFPEL